MKPTKENLSKLSSQWLLKELCQSCLTPYERLLRKEVLRRMTPIPSQQKAVDQFIRKVVKHFRGNGFNVTPESFAKLRTHLLTKYK